MREIVSDPIIYTQSNGRPEAGQEEDESRVIWNDRPGLLLLVFRVTLPLPIGFIIVVDFTKSIRIPGEELFRVAMRRVVLSFTVVALALVVMIVRRLAHFSDLHKERINVSAN